MSRILVAEDDRHLALGLRFNLENAGYEVHVVERGEDALAAVRDASFDLAVLDIMLAGGMDGIAAARELRRAGNFLPILMLTARDAADDRVLGLDAGADDYVTKPFDLDELLARVRGLLRRQVWSRHERGGEEPGPDELVFAGGRIDFRTYRATTCRGEDVELTRLEAGVMRLFALSEGRTVSRETLLEEVWDEPATIETRTVDNFVARLRKYFEPDPKRPRHILSVRGVGYRFVR